MSKSQQFSYLLKIPAIVFILFSSADSHVLALSHANQLPTPVLPTNPTWGEYSVNYDLKTAEFSYRSMHDHLTLNGLKLTSPMSTHQTTIFFFFFKKNKI